MMVHAEYLVGLKEITARVGANKPSVVSNWISRYPGFPEPVTIVSGHPVYMWPEVLSWLDDNFDPVTTYRPKRSAS